MKKLLVLSPRFPFPVIGGDRLRIYKICEQLSKKFELTLLSLCESEEEMSLPVSDSVFSRIERVYLSPLKSKFNVIKALPSSKPLQIAYYSSAKFELKIKELIPFHDAVFAHLIRTGEYIKDKNIRTILEMTDAISLNYKRVAELNETKNLRTFIYRLEQKRLERYEKQIASKFDLVSFISNVDRQYLYPNSSPTIKVYPNGVDTKSLMFKNRTLHCDNPIIIVFIGNMHSLQNMDAARWFAKKILPHLSLNNRKVIFNVIGKIRDSDKEYLNDIPNVNAIGSVNDINEACENGHIGVCPMRLGAGVQNKILEYMALGLPCITSTVGFEGIGATKNNELIVADSLSQYRDAISKLVNNQSFYKDIANNARTFVETKFSWESMITPLVNDIEKLLD
ncbi:glycosyltransferase [Enterobacter pasteurii]|uniref:glycosyltransferase family 4 protein n=1 Tax=Enterobacter pasteurii TaxID=3029761 RepID=UPI0011DDDAFC|nr:glycosyltransferase family 4 protein [Enterobacter pasteurii]QLA70009.1 glycosyltransferase [Enterobacter pasteurii]